MAQLVLEKRELYRDKLQSLLQSVTIATTDSAQQEGEEGDSPCDDDVPCDIDEEQVDHQFLDENDDGMLLVFFSTVAKPQILVKLFQKHQVFRNV